MRTIKIPKCDLLGIGLSVLDSNYYLNKLPKEDEKIEAFASSESLGGPACIGTLTANSLGLRTHLISAIGKDSAGEFITKRNLSKNHSYEFINSSSSSKSCVWIDRTGKRSLVVNEARLNVKFELLGDAPKFILCDGRYSQLCFESLVQLRNKGSMIILDAGSTNKGILQLLDICDYLICSKKFALNYTQQNNVEQAFTYLTQQFDKFTITLGEEGFITYSENTRHQTKAIPTKVKNTNGAGDVFHGAFIAEFAKSGNYLEALKKANKIASLHCSKETIEETLSELKSIS